MYSLTLIRGDHMKHFSEDIRKQVREISKADHVTNWFYILSDYGTISLSIFMAKEYPLPFVYLLAVVIIGSRLRGLENLMHDGVHGNLFANPLVNKWTSIIFCGLPTLTSFHTFFQSHWPHHEHLNDEKKDPDRVRSRESGTDKFPVPRLSLISYVLGILTLVRVPKYFCEGIKGFVYSADTPMREQIIRVIFLPLVLIITNTFGLWQEFFCFWIVPFLTSFQVIRFFAEMTEHGGLYDEQADVEKTRNNFCHPLLRWFIYPHGDYYHLVHHLFCRVPHYNLGIVHRILR
jgi:fatty acid desaturase